MNREFSGVAWVGLGEALAPLIGREAAAEALQRKGMPATQLRLVKDAISAGTAGSGWGAPAAGEGTRTAFLESQRAGGFFFELTAGGRFFPLPPRTPLLISGANVSASVTPSGHPILAADLDLTRTTVEPFVAGALIVISEELAKSASSAALAGIEAELGGGLADAVDLWAKQQLVASGVPEVGGVGGGAAAVMDDLRAALALINVKRPKLALIVSPACAAWLATAATAEGEQVFPDMSVGGGFVAGLQVLVSSAIGDDEALLLDAGGVATHAGVASFLSSNQAALEMLDTGFTQDQPTGASLVSLWQNHLVAIKATQEVALLQLRDDAVVLINHAWMSAS